MLLVAQAADDHQIRPAHFCAHLTTKPKLENPKDKPTSRAHPYRNQFCIECESFQTQCKTPPHDDPATTSPRDSVTIVTQENRPFLEPQRHYMTALEIGPCAWASKGVHWYTVHPHGRQPTHRNKNIPRLT
jgi:hypothetical protein